MTTNVSISGWIAGAQQGDSRALQALWEAYFPKLVHLARQRLRDANRRIADEEDVAISVLESLRAAQAGRFADLTDRDDLWRLLLRMTVRKAVDQYRREHRAKRGGGQVRGESALDAGDDVNAIAGVVGNEPTPEMAALLAEELQHLLQILADEELEQIATAKLEGYKNAEIAENLGWSEETIQRRLRIIRGKWTREIENKESDESTTNEGRPPKRNKT